MLGRHSPIYQFHIPKCGGTSIASWLAQNASDRRPLDRSGLWNLEENFGPHLSAERLQESERLQRAVRRQAFFGADVVSSHLPMRDAPRDAAFSFTVLRRPAARLVSQIADWRRLAAHDINPLPPHIAEVVADAQRLRLADFLARHGAGVALLDNFMTRTLAGLTLTLEERRRTPLPDLAITALENLKNRFAFVGIAERFPETFARLAELLGLPPDRNAPQMNATHSTQTLAQEAQEAKGALDALTVFDREIYDHALALFERRDAAAGAAYDLAAFERDHAAQAVRGLEGRAFDGDVIYGVRDPVLGCGLHGRDGAGLESCCLWSGPAPGFVLYMPAPEGARLQLKLWVRGYVGAAQRAALKVRVDGEPVAHTFEPARGYAEVLFTQARARRPFVALSVDVGATATTGESGTASHDPRRRGLAFDRYGWRALPD